MLDKIIFFSIKNKLLIGLMILALIGWGTYSVTRLPIDAVPDITNNQVMVITVSPSLAAQEVERLITFPVELTMATIPEIEEIRSFSRFGLSLVTIVFKDDVDIYWARQQVTERLKIAEGQIPKGVGSPELAPVTTGLGEIYQYVLHTKPGYENKYSAMELRTIQDWIVKRQLLGTAGVADVSSFGGYLKEYEISIDPAKLRSMNTSISEIFTALQKNNQNTGGAYIDKRPNAYFIRSEGLAGSLEDISKIVVKNSSNGIPVLIKDLAEVRYGHAVRYGASTRNGKGEVVSGIVMMLKGENSSKVITNVKERIEVIQKTLPEGVVIEAFLDRQTLVNSAIKTVTKNLAEGALIVIFVLVLLLGNVRAGLIVASVIPLAMLFAVSMMNLFGVSGNLMSLGAIDFGLIVDGAVIIVESILHRFHSNKLLLGKTLSQSDMDAEVYDSASKIRSSAAFGEIIILIVYLPILALVGVEGKMFKPMAQTVAFAILGAFILSLTYVPMASALFLSKKNENKKNISDKIIDFIYRFYSPAIHQAIRNKMVVVVSAIVLFVISILVFMNMGAEFIPTLEEGDFAIETRVMAGSSIEETIEASQKAARILIEKFPEVKQVVGKIGSGEIPTDPMPIEAADLMVILKDKDEWTSAGSREELAEKMSEALSVIPGVTFGFQQPIQMRFNELMTGAKQDVVVKIYGEDLEILAQSANDVGKLIQPVQGVSDLYVEQITGLPQILVKFNRDKIAQFGLNIEDINTVIRTAFAGEVAGMIFEGEKRFDLVVRLNEGNRKNLEDVRNLYITTPQGTQIPLQQIADVDFQVGPNQIQRDDTKRRIIIGFNVRNRDVESIVKEIRQKIESRIKFPPGYYATYGGQFQNLIQARDRLSIAVPVALLLIFALLFFTFNSLRQSLLIFTAIPLSAIGGVFALWLRGMPFSISAGIGFIALFGVAVLNGIVLIAYFNQLKKEGMTDLKEIVLEGTSVRLRPVIMTALVASLGFLPMALSGSSGAEVQKPLATVVIGGLISATLLTLLVLPVLYILFEKGSKENPENNKGTGKSPVITIVVLLLLLSCPGLAQTPRTLTLDQAINEALQNSNSIQTANYRIDAEKAIKRTSVDLGKTNVNVQAGQFNSILIDNNITVTQTIPFPTVFRNQSELARANIKSREISLSVTENELKTNVRKAYYFLAFHQARHTQLLQMDSIYSSFFKAADIRQRVGESNMLEKASAESQSMEVKSLLQQNEADMQIYQTQLQTLLNSDEPINILENENLSKRSLDLNPDSNATTNSPFLAYFKQQAEIAQKFKNLEKSKMMPDLSFGYFNQSLKGFQLINGTDRYFNGAYRFIGFQAGIAIPIWSRPYSARIKAADFNKKAAESDFKYYQRNVQGQYMIAVQEYLKYKNKLEYFETSALPQAQLIIQNAQSGFRNGAINYVDFLQAMNRALSVQTNHLETLNSYNQSVINIEYIIGNK
jgi:heavy metal efflux system protein